MSPLQTESHMRHADPLVNNEAVQAFQCCQTRYQAQDPQLNLQNKVGTSFLRIGYYIGLLTAVKIGHRTTLVYKPRVSDEESEKVEIGNVGCS